MPLWGMAIMAAAGIAKAELVDKPKADRQRKLKAETDRWSPWTGMKGKDVQEADPFGSALQYGAVGAQAGAAYDQSKSDKELNTAITNYYNRQGNRGAPIEKVAGGPGDATSNAPPPSIETPSKARMPASDGEATPYVPPAQMPASNKEYGNQASNAAGPKQPAWFFGQNPSPYSQPSPYASIMDRGLSPVNPESQWSINPYTPAKWGQPGYNSKNPWGES